MGRQATQCVPAGRSADSDRVRRQQTLRNGDDGVRIPQMIEYACHEGNYAFPGILGGARRLEAENASK